ncbi:phage tail protein [Atlantibacter subterraneus]|uniref:phage tail-collar fiber domain-containing protein n=1 Tax=Atlantibacter subterraneus TaxID=255519 RepID=UPI002FDE316F
MSQTAITLAFEQWKAQQAISGDPVLLDEFVFANVPGLDTSSPVSRTETLPPAGQIVHRQAVSREGVVNTNAVVYSVVLGADVGDFSFNWIGLVNSASGTLAMIVHAPLQQKIKTAEGKQGNVLTRSFLMEFNGAQKETAINTPADTWQIDFTARLAGVDERQRIENVDIYGAGAFFDTGWQVVGSGTNYSIRAGTGYVGGLRAVLDTDTKLTVTIKPVKVWVDACWTGTLTSAWGVTAVAKVAESMTDYEQDGVKHYVFAVARINADGTVTDLRPKNALNQQVADNALAEHEKSRNHPDGTLSAKGFVQLSSATNSPSETLAATPKAVKAVMDETSQKAPKDSPALTGRPTAPTPEPAANDTRIATAEFVKGTLATLGIGGFVAEPATLNWQYFNFIPGAQYVCPPGKQSNIPAGLNFSSQIEPTCINVLGGRAGSTDLIMLITQFSAASNARSYLLVLSGAPGGRAFYVYENFTSASLLGIVNGGTGSRTPDGAIDNLGLRDTVNKAAGAVRRTGDDMTGELKITAGNALRIKNGGRGVILHHNGPEFHILLTNANDPDGLHNNHRPFYIDQATGRVRLGADSGCNGAFTATGPLYAGPASLHTDGNSYGTVWGGWLSNWLNARFAERDATIQARATTEYVNWQLGIRDNNINTRATWDWVNQHFLSDVALGGVAQVRYGNGVYDVPAGCVMTGGGFASTDGQTLRYRPVQKYIPTMGWMTVGHTG